MEVHYSIASGPRIKAAFSFNGSNNRFNIQATQVLFQQKIFCFTAFVDSPDTSVLLSNTQVQYCSCTQCRYVQTGFTFHATFIQVLDQLYTGFRPVLDRVLAASIRICQTPPNLKVHLELQLPKQSIQKSASRTSV